MTRWRRWGLVLACLPALASASDADSTREAVLRAHAEAARQAQVQRAQETFARAHAHLGHGVDFSAANCVRAEPELRSALKLLRDVPAPTAVGGSTKGFALLQSAHCKLAQGRGREAVRLFREAEQWGNAGMVAQARACLAHQYAQGRGVERDPERALALYVLADGESCEPGAGRNVRDAAEQILALNPDAGSVYDGLVYALLRRGSASDWRRMLELHKRHFAGAGSGNYLPIAFGGLHAGGDSEEDRAAARALSLELGRLFLDRGQPALALGYLRMADPVAAAESLQRWQQDVRYRLVLPDGREWKATDAQP